MIPLPTSKEEAKAGVIARKDSIFDYLKELPLDSYDFSSPNNWGEAPPRWREEDRLMVLHRKDGTIEHRRFKDITDYFEKGDLFVLNNTKVIPAFYTVKKGNESIDIILNREIDHKDRVWEFIITKGRVTVGDYLDFSDELYAIVFHKRIEDNMTTACTLQFHYDGAEEEFKQTLLYSGDFYIPEKVRELSQLDPRFVKEYEQRNDVKYVPEDFYKGVDTFFASQDGSICPSAAGLHFSELVFNKMKLKDIDDTYITLHMGLGHFRTPNSDKVRHFSWDKDTKEFSWVYEKLTGKWRWGDTQRLIISEKAAARINKAKGAGKKVVAVGASVMRGLETKPSPGRNPICACDTKTSEFIQHPHRFTVPDAMITSFHMPCTPSLMCAVAFAGLDNLKRAYEEAIRENYRFGPYGDAMLIL